MLVKMIATGAMAFSIFIAATSAASANAETGDEDLLNSSKHPGMVLLRKGQNAKALAAFNTSLTKTPSDWTLLRWRSYTLNTLRRHQEALTDINAALKINPTEAVLYSIRGRTEVALGDFKSALSDCSKAIELRPDYRSAYTNRAYALLHMREFQKCKADCDKAISLSRFDARALRCRGLAESELQNFDLAIADTTAAIMLVERRHWTASAVCPYYEARARVLLQLAQHDQEEISNLLSQTRQDAAEKPSP